MKGINIVLAILCCVSLARAYCSADDLNCEDPISFPGSNFEFYVSHSFPTQGAVNVLLDVTIRLQFTDAIPSAQGFQSYFYLLNQIKGIPTEIPSSCIKVVNEYTLDFPMADCMGDVLEPSTVYVFYVSQRIMNNQVQTLSSIKGIGASEKLFGLTYKSLSFTTTTEMAVDVVPEKCTPAFGATDVSMTPSVTIAFSGVVHIGKGSIELRCVGNSKHSVTVDVRDEKHVVLGSDRMSIVIYDIRLVGLQKYQVVFNSGIVYSASGSKCGTVDNYFFDVVADTIKPYILFVNPKNYKANLPTDTTIRIAFSEEVQPNVGIITFKSDEEIIEVNVQNAHEVSCSEDECRIKPAHGFKVGTYAMSFGNAVFADLSGNQLVRGITNHMFTTANLMCGMEYVQVSKDETCYCQSVDNQCQCQCGDTYFVKNYE